MQKKQKKKKKDKPKWGSIDKYGDKVYNLHPGQSRVITSKVRFTAAIAGTGGGKTVIGPLWLANRIRTLLEEGVTEGMIGMVIAPTYKILSRATVPTLIETFKGTELEGRFLESKGQYILPNNMGKLYLLSADNPDGLEGGQLDIGAWLDEAGQMSERSWLALCRRTGVNEAPIFITTTPYLVNWLKLEFLDRYLEGDEDYFAEIWSSIANPAYPKKEYERARRTLTKATFEMMYGGMFGSLEGMVYPDFASCICEPHSPIGMQVGGIDFGWRAPFCALHGILYVEDGRDILYIDKERYQTKTPLKVHRKFLSKDFVWFADPAEPDSIQDLRSFGFRIRPARNEVLTGVEAVNARILTNRLQISQSCVNLIKEAGVYKYPDKESDAETENPIKGMDHAMDALRYICLSIVRKNKVNKRARVIIRNKE